MRIATGLCITILTALCGCSSTTSSTGSGSRTIHVDLPGFPGVPVTVDDDGSVHLPAWVEDMGRRPVSIRDTMVDGVALATMGMVRGRLQRAEEIHVMVSFHDERLTQGRLFEYEFLFKRPNKFAFLPQGDSFDSLIMVSDGERLLLYGDVPGERQHMYSDAPQSLTAEYQSRIELQLTPSWGVELIMLLPLMTEGISRDDYLSMFSRVHDLGMVRVDGESLRRLQFIGGGNDSSIMEFWVQIRGQRVIRRAFINTDPLGALDPNADSPRPLPTPGRTLATFTFDWIDEPLGETVFQFQVPEDSVENNALLQVAEVEEHPTVGTEAPAFQLPRLDGDETSLEQLHDRHKVIVLDFWATWCAPCIVSLPKLAAAAGEFAEDEVGFYAITYREDENKVRPAVQRYNFTFPILFDETGAVSQSFGITALPHTALIDRHGTIRHVHVGAVAESQIKAEIEALLAEE